MRAKRKEALEHARMRVRLDGIVDAGARQVLAQERVVLGNSVDGQHEEWRRLSLGHFIHFVFVEDKASHNTTLPVLYRLITVP